MITNSIIFKIVKMICIFLIFNTSRANTRAICLVHQITSADIEVAQLIPAKLDKPNKLTTRAKSHA